MTSRSCSLFRTGQQPGRATRVFTASIPPASCTFFIQIGNGWILVKSDRSVSVWVNEDTTAEITTRLRALRALPLLSKVRRTPECCHISADLVLDLGPSPPYHDSSACRRVVCVVGYLRLLCLEGVGW